MTVIMPSRWQHERGNSHANKAAFERAYIVCQRHPSEDLDDLLQELHDGLGAVATETNDPQSCLEHGKALLAIRKEVTRKKGKQDKARNRVQRNCDWLDNGKRV